MSKAERQDGKLFNPADLRKLFGGEERQAVITHGGGLQLKSEQREDMGKSFRAKPYCFYCGNFQADVLRERADNEKEKDELLLEMKKDLEMSNRYEKQRDDAVARAEAAEKKLKELKKICQAPNQ